MRRRLALLATGLVAVLSPLTASARAPELERATIPSAGVVMKIPAGWIASRLTPKLAAQHIVAVWGSPRLTTGFRSTLNVIETSHPPGETLNEWLLGNDGPRYTRLGRLERVKVNGVLALAYTSSKLESLRGKPLLVVEYGFFHATAGYLFTYTSPLIAKARLFAASARTIRFAPTPPAS